MKNIIFLLFIFCFISCNVEKQANHPALDVLQCLNCTEEPRDGSPEYSDLKIVRLETNSSCLLSYIKHIEPVDSLLFILDIDHRLFVFSNTGRFISQIGKKGNAPDEYLYLNTFYVDGSNVIIIDDVKNKLIRYDFHGKYLTSEDVQKEAVWMSRQAMPAKDGHLLLYHGMNMAKDKDENMAYSLLDMKTNKLAGKYFSYSPIKLNNYIQFFSSHPMSKSRDEIHLILPLCDTVYSYPSFLPRYKVETPGKMASKDQITEYTNSYSKDLLILSNAGFFTGFTAIYETEKYIYLQYKYKEVALGYFFADKTLRQGYYYFGGEVDKVPMFPIFGSSDNSLIGVAQPGDLLHLGFKFEPGYEAGRQFNDMLSSLSEEDNPVLFFYEFNDVAE